MTPIARAARGPRLPGESPRATAPLIPLLGKGFRPFFLLGAVFAVAIVPAWLLVLNGRLAAGAYFDPVSWHAHEMLFGFVGAIVAGFLLTAVGNWTQRETAVGPWLLVLVIVWLAGRFALLFASRLPAPLVAAADLAFFPSLLVAIGRPILRARNWRNGVVLAVVAALWLANLAMHLDALGWASGARRPALAAVDLVTLLIVVISGRIVPMFTRNATQDSSVRSIPTADAVAAASVAIVAVIDCIPSASPLLAGAACATASVATIVRARHWGTRAALRIPLLWILHIGHGWVAVGFALRALSVLYPAVPPSLGTHALTAGAIGALTLGMMARVALGHTGRPLVASRRTVAAFFLVVAAAAVRVLVPLAAPATYGLALVVSGAAWTTAFSLYLVAYAPILLAPRMDGKPG